MLNIDSCDREVSRVSQELCMWALSAGGPGEHGVGWMLESEPYCAPTTAMFQHPVCSWALVEPGSLLVCSGLSLKHSSDMQRRRRLKLQAFPVINEHKEQMHNFTVLFWMCCMGHDVCSEKRCWGGSRHSDRQWPQVRHPGFAQQSVEFWLSTCSFSWVQLVSASCLTAACVCSCTGSSSKTADLQSLVHRKGNWARSTLMVFCSRYQQKNVKRRAQKAKY